MYCRAYVVSNKGTPKEQRELVYAGEFEDFARDHIRQRHLAGGGDYGCIERDDGTTAYLTKDSLLKSVG